MNDDNNDASPRPAPAPLSATRAERRPRRARRWIGSAIALLVLAGIAGLAWHLTHRSDPHATGARPGAGGRGGPATTVGTAVAKTADLPVWIDALGTVTPAATVTVRPQVGGVLREVLFTEGQTVKKGQVLALIDPRPYEMALMQAEGQRLRDQAQLENARLTLKRYQTLLAQDSIARQEVDTQAALVRQLEAAIVADRAAEGTARLNLAHTRVVAPMDGKLGLRVVDPGNVVSANDTNGLVVLTQVMPIDVEFSVPQDRVPDVAAAARAGALPVAALDRTRSTTLAEGRFSTLDNQADVQTGTVRAKARFGNEHGTLFPSQFVNVRLQLRNVQGAVVVPVTAVRQGPNGDLVYVLQPDRTVQLRPVRRGIATESLVQITQGLQAGETVVTEGADRLRDGARVALPNDRPASGAMRAASGPSRGASRGMRGASAPWAAPGASWPQGGASAPRQRRTPAEGA